MHSTPHYCTHTHTVSIVVGYLPNIYVNKLLSFLAERLDHTPHLQFYIHWCRELLCVHGDTLKERSSEVMASLRDLQKSILQKQRDIGILYVCVNMILNIVGHIRMHKLYTWHWVQE